MSHKPGGRQVRPDQTKMVNGQNGKTLVTAGTIKGPLSCPKTRRSKNRAFLRSEKKKQSKKKRKKIRKKTEKKRKETKKKES